MIREAIRRLVDRLPTGIRKWIYVGWFHLHRFRGPRSRLVKLDSPALSAAEQAVRLIGFLMVHNEVRTGHLPRVLRHLSEICTDIVVFDCESSDASRALALRYTDHVISTVNDFKNERSTKQKMLEYTLTLDPDWILWLDADEVFERRATPGYLRQLCVLGDRQGIDGFEFSEVNLWKSTRQVRTDELWAQGFYVRLWKNNGQLRFGDGEGLHQTPHPDGLRSIRRSELAVIHYGFASEKLVQEKYDRYASLGQSGFALARIRPDDPAVKLRPLDLDRVPHSALSVTVICLIYASTGYADFVFESFTRHTEDAEFLFIANDATDAVKAHLRDRMMPHMLFENPSDSDKHYVRRVYRAYNFGALQAHSDVVVFINSDMAFSDGWLRNLLKHARSDRVVCSRLVESGKVPSGRHGVSKDFGRTYTDFRAQDFDRFATSIGVDELRTGGLFMPCLIYRDVFLESGGYPIGNRTERDGSITSGDRILFYEKLAQMGVAHVTAFDSVVYHIQQGEMDE